MTLPNLIEVQKSSYNQFLQKSIPHDERGKDDGMNGVFHSVFPVRDFSDRAVMMIQALALLKTLKSKTFIWVIFRS